MEIKEKLKNLPTTSGVYVMKSDDGTVIYVGKAKNLKNRVSQYFRKSPKPIKVQTMVDKIADLDFFVTVSERDALALENNLIKKYMPFFNILLKDDKQFPYIKIKLNEPFPKFEVTRRVKKDGAKYFGPYISGISPHELIKTINYCFPVRSCSLKIDGKKSQKRECLNYHLGLCSAPCTNRISKEDYRKHIDNAIDFLNNSNSHVEKILTEKMKLSAENEDFERAMEYRDKLKMVQRLKEKVISNLPNTEEIDVFAYVSDGIESALSILTLRQGKVLGVESHSVIDASINAGEVLSSFILQYYAKRQVPKTILINEPIESQSELETLLEEKSTRKVNIILPQKGVKKKLVDYATSNAKLHMEKNISASKKHNDRTIKAMELLKEKLNLKKLPVRMECYDISNISGTYKVASMVVFINGEPARKEYRKFKIKYVEGQDDFACMQETLTRRLNRLNENDVSFNSKPDLMIIDGGKGQLSSAIEVLENSGNGDIEIISLAKRLEEVILRNYEIVLLKTASAELRLLTNIRDETHRFAITYHRNIRGKGQFHSPLDEIKGLGKVKKNALLAEFGTSENIKNASVDELSLIKGIDRGLAIKIFEYFNK